MKKTNRKGFTIVELIIVIAVIAILAAVLIPVFSNIVKKANVSSDTQLIRNLNEAVAIDKAEKGIDKHNTMYDSVQACVEQGYNVARIVAKKSSYNIAWERPTGNFVLLDMDNEKVLYPTSVTTSKEYKISEIGYKRTDYFVVTKVGELAAISGKGYSSYAYGDGWTVFETSKGFDAGDVTTITKMTYKNDGDGAVSQNVIIRTNSPLTYQSGVDEHGQPIYEFTTLTIKAPKDTIYWYGTIGKIDGDVIDMNSLNVSGNYMRIYLKEGHINILKNNEAGTEEDPAKIIFTSEDETSFDKSLVTRADGVDRPYVSRSAVDTLENGAIYVATIETAGEKYDYWLYRQGIFEQMVVTKASIRPQEGDTIVDGSGNLKEQYNTPATSYTSEEVKSFAEELCNDPTANAKRDETTGKVVVDENLKIEAIDKTKPVAEEAGVDVEEDAKSAAESKSKEEHLVFIDSVATIGDGETYQFVASQDGVTWSIEYVEGSYGDATIDSNGLFTAVEYGDVIVKAVKGEQTLTCNVKITTFHNGNYTGTSAENAAEIANAKQWYNMCTYDVDSSLAPKYDPYYYWPWYSSTYGYFKLVEDIDYYEMTLPSSCAFNGFNLDGNGKTVSNIESGFSFFAKSTYWDWYTGSISMKNITFENCKSECYVFTKYLCNDVILDNVNFKNCSIGTGIAASIYYCDLEYTNSKIEDCTMAAVFGGYIDNSDVLINNIDIDKMKGITAFTQNIYGGSDVLIKECDVKNSNFTGGAVNSNGQGTRCGGFVGMLGEYYETPNQICTIESCTIKNTNIVSMGANANGFAGCDNGTLIIKDCSILTGTTIKNASTWKNDVCAFSHNATLQGTNKFEGMLYSSDIANAKSNNLFEVKEGINWKKYTPISNWNEVLTFGEDGTLTYIGETTYDKVVATQLMFVSVYDNQNGHMRYDSMSREVGAAVVKEDISTGTTLGQLTRFTNYVNVLCEGEGEAEGLHYSSYNRDLLENPDWEGDANSHIVVKGTIAYMDCKAYQNDVFVMWKGSMDDVPVSEVTVQVDVTFYDNDCASNSVTFYYTFSPSQIVG